jgi:hypothetical protein
MKAAPIRFGLQGNHHQGATTSTQLKLQDWFSADIDDVSVMAVYYAAKALTTSVRRLYLH